MKSEIHIELFEKHEKVNFYTVRFNNGETEVDKFFGKFPENSQYDEDVNIVIKWIDNIGERGAYERYFRREGKISDNVMALPTPIETSNLRLYVIRLSEEIVILGNGGVKNTRTYNEDPFLNQCVELLQAVDRLLKKSISLDKTQLFRKQLFGVLSFEFKKPKT